LSIGLAGISDGLLSRLVIWLTLTYNANALHQLGRRRKEAAMAKTAEILEIPATITDRGQTTVPAAIRKMLALGKRDQVVFRGLADGTVVIAKKQSNDGDPVIGTFLAFLARDMANEPARIRPVPKSLVKRGKGLVKGVKIDLDEALPGDDA
jgi:antitoxin PrlF